MSINGAVKFFEQSMTLFKNGVIAAATSNNDSAKFILDTNRYTEWESIASDDTITETLTITLPASKTFNRMFLTKFNFKDFEVKYWDGASFVAFAGVVGVNAVATTGIVETAYAFNTAYYEFNSVTSDTLQITVLKSQVVDAQKFLNSFIVTEEIGTFEGFPRVKPSMRRNETKKKSLSKKYVIQKSYQTTKIRITFKTHPFQNDLDIIDTLFDMEETFLVYPCGGRAGSTYFKVDQESWKLDSLFNMQLTGNMKNEFEKGVYLLGFNKSLVMEEHV